jgi:hypothetical protein
MGVKFAALCLCLAGRLQAGTLAQHGPFTWGDGGRDALAGAKPQKELKLAFELAQPATVTVEVSGLKRLDLGPNAAPEIFLDDESLGGLQAQHGGFWRSPFQPALGAGSHVLLVRNAAVQDAEDFEATRVLVYAGAPSKALGPAVIIPAKSIPAPRNIAMRPPLCSGHWRRDWMDDLKGGITLSVLNGQQVFTPTLVTMKPGQSWRCEVRIPKREGKPVALVIGFDRLTKRSGKLYFGPDSAINVVGVPGYRPGEWEPLTVDLCEDKKLVFRLGDGPALKTFWSFTDLDLKFSAVDLELGVRQARLYP